ncbi:MAG TPA: hypothetical protein VFQ35_20465, partial [Polyangiaceae bacterium]|nr:hypothetical protein [Polyangiaceae bacterium]
MRTEEERVADAGELMQTFIERTRIGSNGPQRRYLWTDAFALCNLLALARATSDARYEAQALELVEGVHRTLGRFRTDDTRRGWISGLPDEDALSHPTRGGLRIGKPLPERAAHETFDEELEWERDGQYFHYLTKWMHALDQLARERREPRYNEWARELAETACRAFCRANPGGRCGVVWKMSTDLSRPQVSSLGAHDPLDGFVTVSQLRASAAGWHGVTTPRLNNELRELAGMLDETSWATPDALGLGGLLIDACRLAQLIESYSLDVADLLDRVLAEIVAGMKLYVSRAEFERPGWQRLAFRELGLVIGLSGLRYLAPAKRTLRRAIEQYSYLQPLLLDFWLEPAQRLTPSWAEHRDINEVMLATSLVPEGVLDLGAPEVHATGDFDFSSGPGGTVSTGT